MSKVNMKNIIIEGLDGTGKTTLCNYLAKEGYSSLHFTYSSCETNLFNKYKKLLMNATNLVMDRSFISEIVYGNILRGSCRLKKKEIDELINICSQNNFILIYLYASKLKLLKRVNDPVDYNLLLKYYHLLSEEYKKNIDNISSFICVYKFCTNQMNLHKIVLEEIKYEI